MFLSFYKKHNFFYIYDAV